MLQHTVDPSSGSRRLSARCAGNCVPLIGIAEGDAANDSAIAKILHLRGRMKDEGRDSRSMHLLISSANAANG